MLLMKNMKPILLLVTIYVSEESVTLRWLLSAPTSPCRRADINVADALTTILGGRGIKKSMYSQILNHSYDNSFIYGKTCSTC